MTGVHLKYIRERLGMRRQDFALLLGYTGTDRNNENRVKRLEVEDQVPLYIGRLLWLIWDIYEESPTRDDIKARSPAGRCELSD